MFWEIVGLISSWIGAFVVVKVFGPRFNYVFIVPAFLILLFIYDRWTKKIRLSEMKRGWILVFSILCEIGMFTGTCLLLKLLLLSLSLEIVIGLGGITTMVVVGFLLIYFWWAPNHFFFCRVVEGTCKIVVKGGEFAKALIQWKDHTLDNKWNVVEDKERWHPFGGLRFYGIYPIWDIYIYHLRWTNIHQDGKVAQHDEDLDSVMLKDMIYYMEVDGAEDKNRVPLKIGLLLTLRVVNPYKALFRGQDWMELLNRMKPLFREHVAGVAFEDLISEKQRAGGELWKRLSEEGLIQEFKEDYGIEFKDGGIEMKDITPPADYQKAATLKYLAARESERRAGETIGSVINMMAMVTGKTQQEVQAEINHSPKLKKEFRGFCQDLIHRRMAIDGGSYLDIRVTGAEGTERSLLELIAAWKRIPQQAKSQEKKEAS